MEHLGRHSTELPSFEKWCPFMRGYCHHQLQSSMKRSVVRLLRNTLVYKIPRAQNIGYDIYSHATNCHFHVLVVIMFFFTCYSTLLTSSSPSGTGTVGGTVLLSSVQKLFFLVFHLLLLSLQLQVSVFIYYIVHLHCMSMPCQYVFNCDLILQYYTDPDEYKESVDILRKLAVTKNPPAQTIQDLLNETRVERKQWLQRPDISIKDIFEEYPVFKQPKWVSN